MGKQADQPVAGAGANTHAKRPSLLLSALKLGAAIALINIVIDGINIWHQAPSQAVITAAGGTSLLSYRLSMLLGVAVSNLVMWILAALIMLFVLRQLKKF